jgi:carbon monoxide dehydrogenase subunit G
MKLENEFTVPAPVDEAWKVLLDVERVAPCMPGATLLTVDGDEFTGTVKVKVGPIQVTYKGHARFAERDESAHRAVIEASGKEARGSGTASAAVTAVLTSAGPSTTKVHVETDLNVTGRPAQFGRGVMAEVAGKLIDQFANCLADELAQPSMPAATAPTPAPTPTPTPTPPPPTSAAPVEAVPAPPTPQQPTQPQTVPPPRKAAEPIDLLDVAGGSVAKRVAPIAVALVVLLWLLRRRRGR